MSDVHLPDLPEKPSPTPAQPEPAAPPPVTPDDASAQALNAALGASFRIVKLVMVGLVVLFFFSGVFVVQPNEVAVVLRLGKPLGTRTDQLLARGWHFAFPYPIDEIERIPVGQSLKVTSTTGWHATTPEMEARNEDPPAYNYLNPAADGYNITADGNIMHARATIKYRITDPLRYKFGFANAPAILTNIVNNALIYAASRVTAEAAIYKDKSGFRDLVIDRVRQKVDELQLGVTLEPSDVDTKVPVDVRPAFVKVNEAEQERSQAIRAAQGDRDEILRKAVGDAQALVNEGLSSSNRIVTTVQAEGARFNYLLPSYQRDPALLEQRLLLAVVERVMTNAQEKFFQPDHVDELRLNLSREPISKATETKR